VWPFISDLSAAGLPSCHREDTGAVAGDDDRRPAMLNIKTLALSAALVATAVAAPLFGAATQTFAAQRDFTQVNASRVSIVHMYVTATNDPDWGDDVLQHGPIAPGTSRDIGVPNSYARGACLFDMELDASDGTVTYQTNVDLCQGNVTMTFS
jgi:hypothetical protein